MDTQTQTQSINSTVNNELFVKMAIAAWETHNTRVDKLLGSLSDVELSAETAPGRNSGLYLIGHLTAVSDGMLPLLGLGEKLYPELTEIFLANPEKSAFEKPSLETLKAYWKNINQVLREKFSRMTAEAWFTRHTAVSEEDFAKDPVRNKLNLLINRTNHQSYHLGQLVYLVKKDV